MPRNDASPGGDYTLERYTSLKGDILAVIDEQPRK
jgi:hypothetical protein